MSGILATLRERFSDTSTKTKRLEDEAATAAKRAEEARAKVAEAERALAAGEVAPGPGAKALGVARAAYASAFADAGSLADAARIASATRDAAQKAADEQAEAERQAGYVARAEEIEADLREKFAEALAAASALATVTAKITGFRAAGFDVSSVMQDVAVRAAAGARRVHEVRLPLFAVRVADPPDALTKTLAEGDRERERRHRLALRAPAPTAPAVAGQPHRLEDREAS